MTKLLLKDGLVSIPHKNIQAFAIEIYKVKNDLAPGIASNNFCRQKQSQYNLRQQTHFGIPSVRSVYHGSESISCLGPRVWILIPPELKQLSSFISFRKSNQKLNTGKMPLQDL